MFIVGDILGPGVYALTGTVAGEVGGAAWAPFLVAFVIATITAMSYLKLVTKYPQAAGAAPYAHRAFGIHFLTFLVAFTVMCSGTTSGSTASNAFAGFVNDGFGLGFAAGSTGILSIALGFMALVALINFRGVGESVKANVVLTMVELSGMLMIIFIGFYAMAQGRADFSEVMVFKSAEDKSGFMALTAATALAFFTMFGFEASVNMAEEVKDPVRIFPKIMLTELGITGVIYVLVPICAVALVPVGDLSDPDKGSAPTQVLRAGAPNFPFDKIFPFIDMFAVANSALINYFVVTKSDSPAVGLLGGTTALLLLGVFTIVNISLLVLLSGQARAFSHALIPASDRRIDLRVFGRAMGAQCRTDGAVSRRRLVAGRRADPVGLHMALEPRKSSAPCRLSG